MKFFAVCSALVLGLATVSAADTYPASFPYDTEYGEGLPDLNFPNAVPDYSYGNKDTGGYTKLRVACDYAVQMAKDEIPGVDGKQIAGALSSAGFNVSAPKSWTPWYCPGSQYNALTYLPERKSDLTAIKTKCTVDKSMQKQWDSKWAADITSGKKKSFSGYLGQPILVTGEIGTATECTDCCKKFNQDDIDQNTRAGVRTWVPPTTGLSSVQSFLRSDSCTISLGEAAKCFIIESYNPVCVQNYISASKRAFLYPCPDLMMRHYYSCKLRMAASIVADAPEPPKYARSMSGKQSVSSRAFNRVPDRVCQPYSYFYPALKKPAGSTDYYSPNSPLGKNDPSGKPAAPDGSPSSPSSSPTSAGVSLKVTVILASLIGLCIA